MTRRALTKREAIELLLRQDGRCAKCRAKLRVGEMIDEHLHPIALGGGNDLDNRRYLCRPCADVKTRGTGATTHGSDIHAITKPRRIRRKLWPKPSWAVSQTTRETGVIEDVCEHGVGHPNGAWLAAHAHRSALGVHGCDGCCARPDIPKPKRRWPSRPFQRKEPRA